MKISISIYFVNISMCVWSTAFVFPDIKVLVIEKYKSLLKLSLSYDMWYTLFKYILIKYDNCQETMNNKIFETLGTELSVPCQYIILILQGIGIRQIN